MNQRHNQKSSRQISIHALREEGDPVCVLAKQTACNDFYPRPPRGGRLEVSGALCKFRYISIHALREEGDGRIL